MDGVLVVDKPAGPTSHDVVDRVRRALDVRRAGHTGTLDPAATGVLAVCIGKATRLARFLSGGEKVYLATVRLGFATSSDDATGEPLSTPVPVRVSEQAVRAALRELTGSLEQVPPAFSARRVGGRRLYEVARGGGTVTPRTTTVTVHALELISFADERVRLEVRCSAGTYVRALARDLGVRLGCGAHLEALRRTRSGEFGLDDAVDGASLDASVSRRVRPLGSLLAALPAVRVGEEGRRLIRNGRDLSPGGTLDGFPPDSGRVRILDADGELLALAVTRGFAGASPGLPPVALLHPDVVLVG